MNTISAQASKGLTCKDLETVQFAISVAKSSAKLWMPKNMGGNEVRPPNHGIKVDGSGLGEMPQKQTLQQQQGSFLAWLVLLQRHLSLPLTKQRLL